MMMRSTLIAQQMMIEQYVIKSMAFVRVWSKVWNISYDIW